MKAKIISYAIFALVALVILAWQADTAKAAGIAVKNGLVSYWSLDKNSVSGDTIKDDWGNNNGTMKGKANIVNGKVREALELDGSNYVDVPSSKSLNITGNITVEAWVKRNAIGAQHSIVEQYGCVGDAPQVGGFCLRVLDSNVVGFWTLDNCSVGDSTSGSTKIEAGKWYHVVATWNGKEIAIYVNGNLDGSIQTARNPKERGMPLRIGARGNEAGTRFVGSIDEVRVYDRALSQNEIRQNMDAEGLAVENSIEKLFSVWGEIKQQF